MPIINGKHYPYTKKGKEAPKEAKRAYKPKKWASTEGGKMRV